MNWELVAFIIMTVVALCMGGYVKRLIKEIHDLVAVVNTFISTLKQALEDEEVTREELATLSAQIPPILKEARDVKEVVKEIILDIAKLLARK